MRGQLVAMVRIKSRDYRRIGGALTHYEADVVEVFRRETSLGPTRDVIDIFQAGGQYRDAEGRLIDEVDDRFPRLQVGSTLIMVLMWHDGFNGWVTLLGPNGVFEITSDQTVRTVGGHPVVKAQDARPAAAFVAEVRAKAGGGR